MIRRFFGILVLALLAALLGAGTASATTYYIAANGSDSNNGTSKSSPWLHAPGMNGCSAVCSSTTPQPGDSFIFRGGDTWHFGNSGLSPYVGGTSPHWNWNWAGSSSNCNLDASAGAIVKSSCIYIGVDQSWYSGSSWTRPQMNMDNPLTTSRPSSCTYDQDGHNIMFVGKNYVIVDNFEWFGWCWNASPNGAVVTTLASMVEITNNYFHGWTYGAGSSDDEFVEVSCNGTGCTGTEIVDHNVFDGSDASLGTTAGAASGKALGAGSEVAYNVFSHVSNGYVAGTSALTSVHDNIFYYLLEPQGGVHGNIIEWLGQGPKGSTYFYNNLMYKTNEGEGIDMYTGTAGNAYIFNNVSWDYRAVFLPAPPTDNAANNTTQNGANCYMGEVSGTFYVFNNTSDDPCSFVQDRGNVSVQAGNNHYIGYQNQTLAGFSNAATNTDTGGDIFQTESAANAQGYVTGNNYAPTSSGSATVGAGHDNTSLCNAMDNSLAATACTQGFGGITYNQASHVVVPNVPVTRGSTWDAGAYQYAAGSTSNVPNAPSALTATVN